MRSPILPPSWLAGSIVVLVAAMGTSLARADAPMTQGWWSSATVGAPPAQASAAPDVPADGLLVQSGPSAPTAYAALNYLLAPETTADKLIVEIAPTSATSPASTMKICPLVKPSFVAKQAGPIADAPAYDCTKQVVAALDSGGKKFSASVGSLVSGGMLAVALLPGDTSTRIVLSKPDLSSLTTVVVSVPQVTYPTTSASAGSSGAPSTTGAVSAPGSSAPLLDTGQLVTAATPSEPAVQTPVVAAPPETVLTVPEAALRATPVASVAAVPVGHGSRTILLMLGLVGLISALWAFGGSPERQSEAVASAA